MDGNTKETVQGYVIKRAIVFENNQGFALGENPNAPAHFVTWRFNEDENGKRSYYWGHYATKKEAATRDYENRVSVFKYDYGLSERDAYKYYSTQRPVDIGTFPKTEDQTPVTIVNFDTREAVETGRIQAWGYLIYDAPLTEKQIDDYELHAAPDNPDVKATMHEQAQTVGLWEEKHYLPAINRYTDRFTDADTFYINQYVTPERMAERYAYAKEELERAGRQTAPKPIVQQLAEAAMKVQYRDALTVGKNANRDER